MRKINLRVLASSAGIIFFLFLQHSAHAQIPQNAEPFQKSFSISSPATEETFTVPARKRLIITNASAQGMYNKMATCPLAQCTSPSQWIVKDFYIDYYVSSTFNGEAGAQILLSTFSNPIPELPTGVPPGVGPSVSQFVTGSQPVLLYADAGSVVKVGVNKRHGSPRGWTNFFISGYYLPQKTVRNKKTATGR